MRFTFAPTATWASILGVLTVLPAFGEEPAAQEHIVPLIHAHAHNDYEHAHPLFDALAEGFCSVEADIFIVNNQLLVGHDRKDLRPDRTLESLYLEPLRKRILENGGRVYKGGPTIFLLIDVKTEANTTYELLDRVLSGYSDILSITRKGKFEPKAVTVVVSGNRAIERIKHQETRFASIDGRTFDLDSKAPPDLMPWISDYWGKLFHWRGETPMPAGERRKLLQIVKKAHEHGRLVRFWATPERVEVWKELRAAGVDLINTDRLVELRQYLLSAEQKKVQPVGAAE